MVIAISLNKISFVIAKSYTENHTDDFKILYSGQRDIIGEEDRKNPNIIKISRWTLLYFILLAFLGKVEVLLIPHHIIGRMASIVKKFAKQIHYLDDGMDTLRDKPKNFDLFQYDEHSIYYTFKEYKYFGKWLEGKKIEQIASIKSLLEDKPAYEIEDGILVIESPGIKKDEIESNKKEIFLFQHPSPLKQIKWDRKFTKIDSSIYSVENTILAMKNGEVYIGETMSLIICIYAGLTDDVRIVCQMNLNNLSCVRELIAEYTNLEIINNNSIKGMLQ